MERRRAAAALLALAACFACSAAAPTASNPTALELHDGPSEGCYYNFQHYGEGDRIMTNEPCLNCTCHNRMLMCYLRVCPFTKAIGQDCTVEKRADQCCPIVTCPDVPVDLLTSTSTSSPAEYGPTGVGKLDKYGCSINNKYFPEGSKVPSSPNKPCEHCYCIRNMTTCVMQECTLHVDGCTPIYHKDVCCPVRYSCDHLEDEIPLLDDMTTTVRPTQGFLLTTTTMMPVTQMTQDCIHDEQIFPDGASIKTDKACEHCYCMKGDIVCVVQECGTPMENEGKNCTSLPPRQGQCCPDTYICEGDEPSLDLTTETIDLTSAPPRRLGVEGSGYRNEPDEPYTERAPLEHEIEGSGDLSETDIATKIPSTIRDELLTITTEKEVPYSQSTEAEKDLNIITDKISEKEPSVTFEEDSFTRPTESVLMTSTESKATLADEIITIDGVTSKHEEDDINTKAPFHSYEGDEMLPTDSAIEKETSLNVPDQSTLMDEHSVTEATTSIKKETEITLGSAEIVTTERSVVINVTEKESSNDETSEINKIDIMSEMTIADISVTEQNKPDFGYTTVKELNIVDDVTTVSSKKDSTESTSINPVDNEVDYIPGRIPGEGDCLLNGITYNNNTSVPSTNNCHSGCKCISSIVKCDPIICSPPPEYMENMNDCQTSYDTPDACCPTYVCSAKETSLPQSHSQTSVTESSKPVAGVECNGNECSSDEVKQQSSEPNKICDSGNCESESTQNECGINGCQGEEQTPLEHPSNCSGGKCSVAPTVLCDSENCETAPTEEKDVDDKIHSESQGKPICNDADGCDNVKDTSPEQDECKDEGCRRKDTFETETNIPAECSGTQCKIDNEQKIPHIETTIAPVTEYIINKENTEIESGELDTQKTAPPVLTIITPEKTVVTESTINIDTEPATVKVQLPDETLNDVINTEEPVKLITESAISITDNTVRQTEEDITKSETSPSELTPMSDSATEKIKTSEEISTDQGSYTSPPGLDKTEAFTESKLVDYTSENKDTSSEDYTKEVSQTTTEKSQTLSDIYETKPDESFTKLPIVKDTEKEIYTMETPKFPENEVKVTDSEDYLMTTDKIDAISVSDEILGITKQPTVIQENVQTELPESAMEIEGDNRDHSDLVPTEMQDFTTEIVENDKIEDYNKFTTVKSITLSGDTENQTPTKTETPSIISGTVSSESATPEIILADIHKTYTELPQTLGTKSDINESDNKFEEPTSTSSDIKQPEEFSTKLDEAMPEDGHSETETENPDYATTEPSILEPSLLDDDKLNVDLNLDVTEKQTTTSEIKHTDEKEIEEEMQTKLPKVDEITKGTELEMTTESYKETEMKDFVDKDLQTISPFDSKVTESDSPHTSDEGSQPFSELTSKDQLLLQTSTTPQDISLTKDTTTAAVLKDENDIEITSSTNKNELKITSSSDESVTEITGGQELMTELPRDTIEHHPTKDFKLTTLYSENTVIPIETTTSIVISEEKQQTPDLGIPEEAKETIKDITTAVPLLTKEIIDEDIPSSKLPDLISQSEDTSAIPSDEEKMTTSSNDNRKEEEKTEINLQEIAQTTTSNIHISESITEKIDMQPQDHPTRDSSTDESSEISDITEKYLITESPYSQTSSIGSDISNIAPEEYEVDQSTKLPVSAINDDNIPISTSIPLLTQDNEIIITEKIPTPGLSEKEATTETSEYDIVPDKKKQPSEAMPSEPNTDHDIFQDSVTEETKTTEVSPYESEVQNTGITGSVHEDEKSSSEVTKQPTEASFETDLTIQEEHQTIASETSSSKSDTEIDDVRTTESVPIKQEDLPIYPEIPVDSIHTISDESYTTATRLEIDVANEITTTEVVPRKHEELPIQSEIAPIPTVLPNLDTTKADEGVSKIESATLPTESSETSKPSLITSTEVSKTDTTKLIDVFDEQTLSSKVPDPSIETTSRTETEGVTELEDTEPYTTEKQYISISDQEEVPKVPELPAEHAQTDTETENKQEDFGTATTEKQYVTKSDQEDIPKIPVLIDEQGTSQGDIESVTELDHTEHVTTVNQYVTKANERVPEVPKLPEEQNIDQTYTEVVSEKEDSEPFTTEKMYVTKLDQDSPKFPEQAEEQSTSRIDTESITKLEDMQPSVTEKQYLTDSPQEEVPKIPEQVEEQSTSPIDTESITKLEETQPSVTEKQHVTDSQDEVPKVTELIEEQSTSRVDTESITKLADTQPSVTEKQYVTDSPQEEVPKVPEQIEEQSTSRIDTESITKLEDTQPSVTEEQHVTDEPQDEVPKVTKQIEEQSTIRIDTESITKLEDSQPSVTEKQYVTDSPQDEVPIIPVQIEEQSTSRIDTESITKLEEMQPSVTEKQNGTDSPRDEVPKVPEQIEEQSTSRIDTESITKLEDTEPSVTEKQYVTDSPQDEVPKVPEQIEEQSTSRIDTESITKLEETQPSVTEKQYETVSPLDEVPKIPVVIDEQSTSQSSIEDITKLMDIEAYTTEKQYVTKSDEEVSKIQEPSEEQSTTRTDIENEMKEEDSKSSTTEKPFVTKTDQEHIPNIPVVVDEQSTSQSDIESVTKLDDTESFVTEKQYSMTNSDQEEVPKIPVVTDEEGTSEGDRETIKDIEPYTTEKQYVTKSDEEVQELPKEPAEEQSTDRIYTAEEDSGLFTTERQLVTKLEQEVPKLPEQAEDQSTSRYDSESITKLEDIEPFVTEKQYVSSSGEEETSKFPVLSEEQSTSRIDTESVTTAEDSGTDHDIPSSHKLDADVSKPDQDNKNLETITTGPINYPDTTIKSELEGSDLIKPSEDVTVVPQKDDSTELNPTEISIPEKVETPTKTVTEDDFEKYSTERNVQTSVPAGESVILEEVTEAKPYETEHKTPSKLSTDEEGTFSETTPYSVLLEEHTHLVEETSSSIPIEEGTTLRNEVLPERGDQIPDTPEINDEYEHTTAKQVEVEKTTVYEKISSPVVQSDATETTTIVEKITPDSSSQGEDNKYSPSIQDEATPVVVPTIKEKEQHTTPPTILDKEMTTLGGIVASSEEPEITSSSSKGDSAQELLPSSTSKLQEESTTHLPPSEDKYKEKPFTSSPSPSTSELPEILEEPHEEEHSPDFPPSGTGAGYGQEPDYVEEDQAFGPGTCRYGGKVYVSAQQIPRDDPCDFCFCFRSDIICLQQSCPPPIHGCHEEPIQGFCCPRYECPVSMATTVNVTTTTTTTTTTLPPHFLPHAYKGAAQRRGCQIKGHSYKVGEVVRASSGPCLHCTCGGDGQMKCDPKACTPEPMLRQMIAAAVSAKRRR